jgi:hypothetical protein
VGIGVLALLAVVTVGLLAAQSRFNPAVTARETIASAPEATVGMDLAILAPTGIVPMSPPEQFTPETLSDKINGKAELYFSAGFQALTAQRFSLTADPSKWFEVFVYDMGTARNAFSVFSMQRRGDTSAAGPTPFAYGTPNGRFLARGAYYLEIVGAEASEPLMAAADEMTAAFVAAHGAGAVDVDDMDLFPADGLVTDSRSLVASDAFGIAGFNQVYTAAYRVNGMQTTAYAARRDSAAVALADAAMVRDFYLEYGGSRLEGPEGVAVIDILDTIEVVFAYGPYVIGVHEGADPTSALELAERIRRQLEVLSRDGS